MVEHKVIDNEMIIKLPERVDTESCLEFERELFCLINRGTNTKTVFDAEDLEFISSSALGVLEKLRLEFGNLKIINLKPDVYEAVKNSGYSELY